MALRMLLTSMLLTDMVAALAKQQGAVWLQFLVWNLMGSTPVGPINARDELHDRDERQRKKKKVNSFYHDTTHSERNEPLTC